MEVGGRFMRFSLSNVPPKIGTIWGEGTHMSSSFFSYSHPTLLVFSLKQICSQHIPPPLLYLENPSHFSLYPFFIPVNCFSAVKLEQLSSIISLKLMDEGDDFWMDGDDEEVMKSSLSQIAKAIERSTDAIMQSSASLAKYRTRVISSEEITEALEEMGLSGKFFIDAYEFLNDNPEKTKKVFGFPKAG